MKLKGRLNRHEKNELLHHLESEVGPRLKRQQGKSYAPGREHAWLVYQPDYGRVPRAPSCPRGAICDVLQRHVAGFELAECFRNAADGTSSRGINPHRDHTFAASRAWLINLGPTYFRIWMPRDHSPSAPGFRAVKEHKTNTEFAADLEGDEILEFNCKMWHASATDATSRWGIGLWTFNPKWKVAAGLGLIGTHSLSAVSKLPAVP